MGKFILNIIKFILAVFLLPIVFICADYFAEALNSFPKNYPDFFWWGALSFLLIFLFVYRFTPLHEFGINMISAIFRFIAPLDRFLAYVLPFYVILVFLTLSILTAIQNHAYDHYFLFFAGFFLAMHEILIAQELQDEEKNFIKPAYFFVMSLVFILNICLVLLFFDLILKDFSFQKFFQSAIQEVKEVYLQAFEKIHKIYLTIKK